MLKQFLMFALCLVTAVWAQDDDENVKAQETIHEKPPEWRMYSAGAPVVAFAVAKDALWYATQESVYSTALNKVSQQKFPQMGKIASSDVTCMTIDASGKVWVGGRNGVAVRSGNQFTSYTTEEGLPDNSVNDIAASKDGKIYVGTENGAAVFQNGSWKKIEGLVSEKVQALVIDKKGAVWFGTNRGISVNDNGKWTVYDMKNGKLSWNDVKALAVDERKGTIWAAVGEKDVNSFENGVWKTYLEIQEGIKAIMVDSQSRIWFGTETGLIKFNGEEWNTDSKQFGIPAAQIQKLYKDGSGNLWFAMESGVIKLNNPYPF
jgi:ligand-binding sensor domain-containing protein